MKNIVKTAVFIFVFLAFFTKAVAMGRQYASPSEINKPAPDFNLSDINGNEVSLSSFNGKKNVVLFFWTTWCPHCRREIRYLNAVYDELKENNTEILAIDIDESISKIAGFISDNPTRFAVLLDDGAEIAQDYDIFGVPTYVIIDKSGTIRLVDHVFPEDYQSFISD